MSTTVSSYEESTVKLKALSRPELNSAAMPHPGLCRLPAPWQLPELFLGGVIRHSLAPAEDLNTELATIRFAQAYLVVTSVIDPKPRLARRLLKAAEAAPKNNKGWLNNYGECWASSVSCEEHRIMPHGLRRTTDDR